MAQQSKPQPLADYSQPYSVRVMLERFLQALQVRNYAATTIRSRREDLLRFVEWCEARDLNDVREISDSDIEKYQRWLANYRRADGRPLNVESQVRILCSMRVYFSWLTKAKQIKFNPASEIELPKVGKRLPRAILTEREMEQVLQQPNINTLVGIRDRAIMETFYSTGIRRAELVALRLQDLNIDRGMLAVRAGKGGKDRIIPIGERALAWIEKYLQEVRDRLCGSEVEALFVNKEGQALAAKGMGNIIRKYLEGAQIAKSGSCHIFRHTMATLMLEGGADIRYIQQMLGHEDLSTTQVYTRVSDRKLKEVHTNSHPGARLKPQRKQTDESLEEDDQ